ncbi:hypothetical protein AAFF_G00372250 [Aldrovandia affinis]|uniref:Sugar phosphate transporter domain-containing protein n=1 Tax=Aldrovandia affinis TaxID=143900 RepID=A0AAD7SG80_9TELE|nr:hypothetical protein AAFF_G00372250 [Aldrovandia affinis]
MDGEEARPRETAARRLEGWDSHLGNDIPTGELNPALAEAEISSPTTVAICNTLTDQQWAHSRGASGHGGTLSDEDEEMEILNAGDESPAHIAVTTVGPAQCSVGRRRRQIPEKPNHTLGLWNVIKNCLGKELSKTPVPVRAPSTLENAENMYYFSSLALTLNEPEEGVGQLMEAGLWSEAGTEKQRLEEEQRTRRTRQAAAHRKRREDEANMITADGLPKLEATPAAGRPPEMLHLLPAVVVWLVTGTTISSLNKWIFAVYNFRYPLLLSALHMLTAIVVDYGLIKLKLVRRRAGVEQDLTASAKFKVFLLSLTFCASIAFGNVGLNYVQLSFAQMIYTTTPIFTLAISTLVLGKQHHILKYTAMMPICLGASFSVMGEVQFDQTGCLFVFAATMLRGVKSIQQSILLQEEKINSVFLLYLMSIPSFCILAVAALVLENWALLESPLHYDRRLWLFILLSCLGSVLYNLASCCVITLTSAVTLHILGNLSVVGNLLLSQLLFGSQLSALSCAGAALTLSGMLIYQNSELIGGYLDSWRAARAGAARPEPEPEPESEPERSRDPKPDGKAD